MSDRTSTRYRDTQGLWQRVLWLDQEVRANRFPNAESLVGQFEVSRRTAFNTIDHLRTRLGAPLEYHRGKRGYFYTDPVFALPTVYLQEGELLALLLAEEVTRQYLGTPLEAPLRSAVEKLCRYLPDDAPVHLETLASQFHFAGGNSVDVPLSLLADVVRAVRERRVLRIDYYTAGRDEWRVRDVEPHFLQNVRGDWMLIAWDRWREESRVFMLSRVREHAVLDAAFRVRPELRPDVYTQHHFLTEHGAGEPQAVVLRFDAYQARWIRERRWHPSQELEELPDGGMLLRLNVSGEGDLMRWVLGYGQHVEVLQPARLRERVAAELAGAATLYGETL